MTPVSSSHNGSMDTVSALLWRGGALRRGVLVGLCVGLFFGGLAWLDSGVWIVGLIVFVVLTIGLGAWTTRQAARYWPGARELTGAQRESVVTAAHRGERIDDPKLAGAVGDYGRGLHRAADDYRPLRWMLVFLLVVAIGSAAWDAVSGTWGNVIVSAIYLVLIGLELFWWPRRQAQLLANADRAADLARQGDNAD